jgi:hypothetical protein
MKSAYDRFFTGAVGFEPADRIWKTWAPPKCALHDFPCRGSGALQGRLGSGLSGLSLRWLF